MQVQLTEENQKLVDEYREAVRLVVKDYDSSTTQIVNHVVEVAIRELAKKIKKSI